GDQGCVGDMVKAFRQRHDFVVESLNSIDGVRCLPSDGTFYAFPDFSAVIERMDGTDDDLELPEHRIENPGVALVPASAFGVPGYVRLSYATSMENLEKALQRIADAV